MQTTSNRSIDPRATALGAFRLVAALVVSGVLMVVLAGWTSGLWSALLARPSLEAADLLVALIAGLAVLLLAWLWLGVLLEGCALASSSLERAMTGVPRALRPRIASGICAAIVGVTMVGTATGAHAAPTASPAATAMANGAGTFASGASAIPGSVDTTTVAGTIATYTSSAIATRTTSTSTGASVPTAGWRASAPTVRAIPSPNFRPTGTSGDPTQSSVSPSSADGVTHVVLRGESLWSIAAAHLGSGASDAEIAAEWPRWFAANRTVIGTDPDVILPGQVLSAPGRSGAGS